MSTVSSVLSSQNAGGGTVADSTKKHGELGQSEFLKLLITQLEHQDPLKPTDSDSFIQQVTGFNQLDQLIKLVKIGEKQLEAQGVKADVTTSGSIIQPGTDYTPPEFKLPAA